ncbi:RNA-binding domain-containing protein [Basidiobolus meristosporus CBS 931.73]|uniref:RNA-binding domain-containing protein n=1 Tax=Basidiobolus meristosporus CBS 931.73 TaxID=1314790 RepID=A0A1Y1ZCU5_9FUNG|nr:RNA-binding domain-containing protein [Basidiobolus meristosporus CBS 931.73]|eukprot:ORY08100.1 RNA-binding domain-containing protein [Basidiobolus meristosporus CBS 931.73]
MDSTLPNNNPNSPPTMSHPNMARPEPNGPPMDPSGMPPVGSAEPLGGYTAGSPPDRGYPPRGRSPSRGRDRFSPPPYRRPSYSPGRGYSPRRDYSPRRRGYSPRSRDYSPRRGRGGYSPRRDYSPRGRRSPSPRYRDYSSSRRGGPPKRPRGPVDRGSESERLASTTLFRERDVADLFERFGRLRNVTVTIDRYTNRNKGFAFVEFEDRRDAEDAFDKYHNFVVEGRRLKMDWDIGRNKKDARRPPPPRRGGGPPGYGEESYGYRSPPPRDFSPNYREPVPPPRRSQSPPPYRN